MQYELKIDKELESLCPALSADELRLLEESIAADGCRDEIVLWANHDKTVIDGHNRYRICEKLGKTFKTMSLAFDSKDEVKLWMLRNQMGRRNLSDSQRAMMAARMVNLNPGDNQHTKEVMQICTTSDAANHAAVSPRTVASARKVIEQGTPELQKLVTDGEVAVSAAAEVSKKPKAEQKKIVAKGPAAVKAAAKESKAKPKISGGATFDIAEIEAAQASEQTDSPDLAALQAPYDVMLNAITQIKKLWNEVTADERDGVYVAQKRQRVLTLLDDLRPPIAQARPMKVCTFCKGKGCEKCSGCGWWPRSVVEGLSR